MVTASTQTESVSVSVYYVAVRTIVLSCHGSYLARPVITHPIMNRARRCLTSVIEHKLLSERRIP